MKRYRLGNIEDFQEFPHKIVIGTDTFFLVKKDEQFSLFSSVCPHVGGEIVLIDGCFECPIHQWRFDKDSGQCLNNKNRKLSQYDIQQRDGALYVDLPIHSEETLKPERNNKVVNEPSNKRPIIKMHAHACLEFIIDDFSLLMDPWIEGPAFLGAWHQYPAPVVKTSDLKPSAIWISHEHSDHFHEPTLAKMDKSIPVYFPDFPNRRMEERLKVLGFQQIIPMPFGKPFTIGKGMTITCFEPLSLWNDALVLVEVNGFRFLNLNDAGLNPRIAEQIGPVDVIATGFSPGASGYPLTWNHLTIEKQTEIMEKSCEGILSMLDRAMKLYGSKYLLPFASHFELWHPSHSHYVEISRKNTLEDVVRKFSGRDDVTVIDLLPGESWDTQNGAVNRMGYDREELYRLDYKLNYLKNIYDEKIFHAHHPRYDYNITNTDVEEYFLRLNDVPEIIFCDDVTVQITATKENDSDKQVFCFQVTEGNLKIVDPDNCTPNIWINIPLHILAATIRENLSWDEAIIGYWCNFYRDPDIYHGDFWRLLQTPYYRKKANLSGEVTGLSIEKTTIIADLIEKHGDDAERILRRYGLYCAGCHRSTFESLEMAAKAHGIEQEMIERLTKELNILFTS